MSHLEIRYFTGDIDERALSKEHPVSIGRSASNDICVDEDEVAPMHCRIGWSPDGYTVESAGTDGVEVNGTLVQRAILRDQDMIRIGTVDIAVQVDDDTAVTKSAAAVAATAPPEQFEAPAEIPAAVETPAARLEPVRDEVDDYDDEIDDDERKPRSHDDDEDEGELSRLEQIRRRLDREGVRPGEREIIRSKFLISLIVGMVVLALVSGILWFWTNRNAAEKLKFTADEDYNAKKYTEAISRYTQFLDNFPENDFTEEVFYSRAKARILKEIDSSAPKWAEGLEQVREFERENKDRESFKEQRETLREYAKRIATGAVDSAAFSKDPKLLPVAVEARDEARRFGAGKEFEKEFKSRYERAKYEVERKQTFDAGVKGIKAAIAAKQIDNAIQLRLDLMQKLADAPRPKEKAVLDTLLDQTMAGEMSLILAEDLNRNGINQERPGRKRNPRSLTSQVRPQESRTSDKSQIVIALAKNCCYGVDAVTSEPLWRRVTGTDLPFFPMSVKVGGDALLYYDTDYGDLTLIRKRDGGLIWRQQLLDKSKHPESLAGPPLVSQGQIFLPTLSRRLYKIDLNSGRVERRLTFSQRLLAPPVMAPSNDRVIVAGNKALIYTVAVAPKMECKTVNYIGHRAGSVRVPLMRIGQLVLMCENIGTGKNAECRLRVLNSAAKKPANWLQELTFKAPDQQVRVPGHLLEKPVGEANDPQLRGKMLFVVSGGKYVSVFTVSDDTNQPESERNKDQFLRQLDAPKEFDDQQVGPVYILTQPNRQFWIVSSQLSRFQMAAKAIRTPKVVPFNRSSQPPVQIGEKFYLGRQGAFSSAVTLSETDPLTMRGTWSLTLGAKIIATTRAAGQPVVCLNEEGLVFRVQMQDIAKGGFHVESTAALPLPKGTKDPLRAVVLPDGGIVAAGGSEKGMLWFINAAGQLERTVRLPSALQADPIVMGDGVVVPLKGRLRYLNIKGEGAVVEDFQLPFAAEKDPPSWLQIAALNPRQLVALTSDGKLMTIASKTGGSRAYLAKEEQSSIQAKLQPGFAVHQGSIIVADAKGTIHVLNSTTLQADAAAPSGASRVNALWVAEGYLFAETDRTVGNRVERHLQFYSLSNGLKRMWEQKLVGNAGLAGPPKAEGGQILIAQRNGHLAWIDPANGQPKKTVDVADAITDAPAPAGGSFIVPTLDGSLLLINPANGG